MPASHIMTPRLSLARICLVLLALLALEGSDVTAVFADPLRFYPVEPFDFIYPETEFSSTPISSVRSEMARNEYEPLTFAVVSAEDFPDVTVVLDGLSTLGGKKIGRENIDIRVVKVWDQAGTNYWPTKEVRVPELLLTDDTVPFVDKWENGIYFPPLVPSSFKTSLAAGKTKQFWITVKTSEKQHPPGTYTGVLRFFSRNSLIAKLKLVVEVLPIILPAPSKDYVIYFRSRVNPDHPEYTAKELYMLYLSDLKEHGFTGISSNEADIKAACEVIDRVQAAGLSTVIMSVLTPLTQDVVGKIIDYAESRKIRVWFHGYDEPDNEKNMLEHVRRSGIIHAGGGKVVTSITKPKADALKTYASKPDGSFESLDWPNYHVGESQSYIADIMKGTASKDSKIETYYWQIYLENPSMNRLYAGFYLWKSRMDGVFPYCYQSFRAVSPYNDGDVLEIKGYKGRDRKFRVFNVAYPSQQGAVPTLQWEATREGVDDVRYLTKLTQLAKTKGIKDMDSRINELLVEFRYVGIENSGVQLTQNARFSETRKKVKDLILSLQSR